MRSIHTLTAAWLIAAAAAGTATAGEAHAATDAASAASAAAAGSTQPLKPVVAEQVPCPSVSAPDSVYPAHVYADGVVTFEATGDKHNPLGAVLYRGAKKCSRQVFDKYEVAGATPEFGSIFNYTVHGVENLFVIVTWATDHSGVGIKGTSYQVYAYEADGRGGLRLNEVIRYSDEMSGIDGMDDFEPDFFGKTPQEVKELIDRLGLK